MTFHELFVRMNAEIDELGFENLDFAKNLGHSIERHIDRRRCIEEGCSSALADVSLFTFEPHIRRKHGLWGFKHEDIYYFEGQRLRVL